MATNRIRKSLMALSVLCGLAATARGQSEDDYAPGRVGSGDIDLGAPADLSLYGGYPRPNAGWWGKAEGIYWIFQAPDTTTIGRDGFNPPTFDGNRRLFQPNTVDTGFIESDWAWGNRLEGGYMGEDNKGWMIGGFKTNTVSSSFETFNTDGGVGVSFLPQLGPDGVSTLQGFTDINGDGFDDDHNQNNIFGRDGEDIGQPNPNPPPAIIPPPDGIPDIAAPTDFGDLVYFPIFFDAIRAENKTRTFNIELMRVWRRSPCPKWVLLEWFAGARYFYINDKFNVEALGGILNPNQTADLDVSDGSYWNSEVENNLVGGQFGVRAQRKIQRLGFIAEGRGFIGANFQNYNLRGQLGNGLVPGADNQPVDLGDTTFRDSAHSTVFAPGGELRLQLNYQVTNAVQLQVGWTGMYFNGIARASQSIDYVIPGMQVTTANNEEDLFIQGVNFGVEINR